MCIRDRIGKASLTLGVRPIMLPWPRSWANMPGLRYVGLQYTVATGPLTAGKFTAALVLQGADSVSNWYASGYTIK